MNADLLARFPSYYRYTPGALVSLDEARAYTQRIARGHYENFTVVSWFLPKEKRQHFFNVYAYCRWSDDLGDEIGDPQLALELLHWWREELHACYRDEPRSEACCAHPVFVALLDTIRAFDIPMDPFDNLLTAFIQDQTVTRYETYDDLLGYCVNSANPVGRLVLYLCGYRDEERQRFSDATCTALQLTNFWQDVTVDWQKDRVYIPLEDLRRFGVTVEEIGERKFTDRFAQCMKFEVERTRELFREGMKLCDKVDGRVRRDIELFNRGGMTILDLIERQSCDVLSKRPALNKWGKIKLMLSRVLPFTR